MRVVITGGGGFIGQKLARRLARDGAVGGREITHLVLHDIIPPSLPEGAAFPVETQVGDVSEAGAAERFLTGRPDVVVHLAAIVSGEAEQDLDKGYRINMTGTQRLLEAARGLYGDAAKKPRLILASSIAVFGAPFPEAIPDDYHHTPLTSYGTQKAISELLLADYTRKGFVDGVGLRFPTICVRPGKPNKAASGFFSNICREPLAGQEAVLPVGEGVRHWFASPRAAVGFLLHAIALKGEALGAQRTVSLPGLSVTVAEQIAALGRLGGPQVVARIKRVPDPFIERIVAGWPSNFRTERALKLGFAADGSFDDIVRGHIDDELGGVIA